MADFTIAYAITMKAEGGYANNPTDTGGETFGGIARNANPKWSGWKLVDAIKAKTPRAKWDAAMFGSAELMASVRGLYKINYWDVNRLDVFASQAIANEMFDTGVNMGTGTAAKFLQRALNITNRNQQLYRDVAVDGVIGPVTVGLVNKNPRPDRLYKWLNIMQGARYLDIMEKAPAQEAFADSWLSRVDLVKV